MASFSIFSETPLAPVRLIWDQVKNVGQPWGKISDQFTFHKKCPQ